MKQKNNITLLVIGVLTLLVAIVGAAYAYFSSSITPGSGLNLDVEAQANTAQFTASGGQFGFTVTGAEMQQANAGTLAKEATGSINVSLTSPKIAMCTFDVAFAWNSGSSYTATSGRGSQFEFGVLYEGNPYGAINNAIKPINFDTLISNGGKVLDQAKIIIPEANGTSKTETITLNFKVQMYNLNHDQSALAGSSSKTYSGRFYVTNVDCQENKLYLNDVILASNEIYPDNVASTYVTSATGINFGQISSDTNGKGVYYTNKNTENNDYTYYFRGDVENNYVEFGSEIVPAGCSYDGDPVLVLSDSDSYEFVENYTKEDCENNTLYKKADTDGGWDIQSDKGYDYIVYINGGKNYLAAEQVDGTATYLEEPQYTNELMWRIVRVNEDGSIRLILNDSIGNSEFNFSSMNEYTTYMYGSEENVNSTSSTIKTKIDEWYSDLTNLSEYPYLMSNTAGFCSDRIHEYNGSGSYDLDYATTIRIESYMSVATPQYKCTNKSRDLFTINSSTEGNKALTYPVGLITVDEVAYAGGVRNWNASNLNYYLLYNDWYWTMSPYEYDGDQRIYMVRGSIDSDPGSIDYQFIDGDAAVRPVVNLKNDIKIVSGTGTKTNPYVLSLEN